MGRGRRGWWAGGGGGEGGAGEGGGDEENGGEGAGGEDGGDEDGCGETVPPVANGGGVRIKSGGKGGMQREARWGATIPGTGASGATGHVGEMRGIIAVPPWSRQAGGEADGGEEGVARGGAQRGESDGEAEMA